MKIVTWLLQILLALAFVAAGAMKLTSAQPQLVANGMAWAEDFSDTQIKLIGAAEVAGGLGLVIPAATGIMPILTPVAAAALALLMGGAVATHLQRGESPGPAAVLMVLAALAAFLTYRRTLPARS